MLAEIRTLLSSLSKDQVWFKEMHMDAQGVHMEFTRGGWVMVNLCVNLGYRVPTYLVRHCSGVAVRMFGDEINI